MAGKRKTAKRQPARRAAKANGGQLLESMRQRLRPKTFADLGVTRFLTGLQQKIAGATVMPGGSYAKGTSIAGLHDIDVFVRFPKGTLHEAMYAAITAALPKAERLHGSRDYFQVKRGGKTFELVPVIAIDQWREAENITDMSPLHVTYVASKLSPKQKDDVRLAKQFCKAAGVYGAESFIRGFSGYVLELLVLHYGGFEKLLKAARAWKLPHTVIDHEGHYASPGDALRRLNDAKIAGPLVLVDPIQPERNAAAALSEACFRRFVGRAKAFLAKPSSRFFDETVKKSEIKKQWRGKRVVFVTAKTPTGKVDVVGCKVVARHDDASRLLRQQGFGLVHAEWRFGEKESLAWYVLERTKLPATIEREGPPSTFASHVAAFRARHPGAVERRGRWYAVVKREFTSAKQALKAAWKPLRHAIS